MQKFNVMTIIAAVVMLVSGAARAAPVLDQQAAPFGGYLYEGLNWQQTVTAGVAGQLSGLTLYGAGTNVTVRVSPGQGFYAGPFAYSQNVQLASGGTFIDLSAAGIQLAAGDRFVIDLINGSGGNIARAAGPYAGGHLFAKFGVPVDYSACCESTLAFQTFMDAGSSGAVPEPGAWALMILGFGGAGAMLRGRRVGGLSPA
ncbi:MAG: PEPxxWA-CTERM sorting domain-containing protein [Pseudomonadota bacterium]